MAVEEISESDLTHQHVDHLKEFRELFLPQALNNYNYHSATSLKMASLNKKQFSAELLGKTLCNLLPTITNIVQ